MTNTHRDEIHVTFEKFAGTWQKPRTEILT